MARPTSRALGEQPRQPLTPAPDTGQPFTGDDSAPAGAPAGARKSPDAGRKGKQLGARLPADLFDRLKDTSDRTGVPMTTLVVRAIRAELDRIDAASS